MFLGQRYGLKEPRTVFAAKTQGLSAPSGLFPIMPVVQETRWEFPATERTRERPIGFEVLEPIVLVQGLGDSIGGLVGTQRAPVLVYEFPMGNAGLEGGEWGGAENAGDERSGNEGGHEEE
jgi:hypothetical protein